MLNSLINLQKEIKLKDVLTLQVCGGKSAKILLSMKREQNGFERVVTYPFASSLPHKAAPMHLS